MKCPICNEDLIQNLKPDSESSLDVMYSCYSEPDLVCGVIEYKCKNHHYIYIKNEHINE